MKIQYMSDLHMELRDNSQYIKNMEIPVTGDVLVLAGDNLTSAFATELGGYIADNRINAWIYGHSHTNIDTQIGNTRIVSN